jgi:hypothetical protein
MQDTDSSTSSDVPDNKGSAKASKPGGAPADPTDRVLEALDQATAVVTGAKPEQVANAIKSDLESFLKRLIPPPPEPVPDICGTPSPSVRGFCNQRKLSYQQAKITYDGSKEAATTGLRTALSNWNLAVSEYEFAMSNADATLRAAVTDATNTYNQKQNPDSHSRSFYLWFTLKQATAAAIVAYEGSATSAAATLSGAAGDLLAAYQGYIDAINAAQSQRLDDEATADQTLWQNVEGVLDAV